MSGAIRNSCALDLEKTRVCDETGISRLWSRHLRYPLDSSYSSLALPLSIRRCKSAMASGRASGSGWPAPGGEHCVSARMRSSAKASTGRIRKSPLIARNRLDIRELYENQRKECRESANSPPQPRRGGRDIKKNRGATLLERTGWCWSRNPGQHHPVCAFQGCFAAST